MAYGRLYKVIQDGAIGYQTINQLADNAADIKTQMGTEHGTVDKALFAYNPATGGFESTAVFDRLGHHNITDIPRSVAQSQVFSQLAGFGLFSSGLAWVGPAITAVQWISTGVYFLPVVGLSTFWGKVTVLAASGVQPLEPQVRSVYASPTNGPNNGLKVSLYKLSGGTFVPDDQTFTIALYGTP